MKNQSQRESRESPGACWKYASLSQKIILIIMSANKELKKNESNDTTLQLIFLFLIHTHLDILSVLIIMCVEHVFPRINHSHKNFNVSFEHFITFCIIFTIFCISTGIYPILFLVNIAGCLTQCPSHPLLMVTS